MNALRLLSRNVSVVARPQNVRYFQSSRAALGPILEATDANFQEHIKRDGPILVDFHADWCGPCRFLDPVLRGIADSSDVTLVKVNVDDCPETSGDYQIASIPCVMAFKDGQMVGRFVGALPKHQVEDFIKKAFDENK